MSYTQLYYHVVFRTYRSERTIHESHERELYNYIWGIVKKKRGVLHRIGGMSDHIHMFVQLPPSVPISELMRDVKAGSSAFAQSHPEWFPHFKGWGRNFCAVTHNYANRETVVNYIKNPKEHHKKVSLDDEFTKLFRDYDMEDRLVYLRGEK